jgi:hypothetical protein
MVYSVVRRTIEFPYKRRYGVRTQYSTRSTDGPLIERGVPTFDEDPLLSDRTGSRRTEFFEIATRFGPSRKLLYEFLRHLFPGVTLEPGE